MSNKPVPLLRADPHRWGNGLVHQIDDGRDTTLCGKSPAVCPGTRFSGPQSQITCKVCRRSIESQARYQQYREEERRRERQRESDRAQWHTLYAEYLRSEPWRRKRNIVLRRAGSICEGCGEKRPLQVHHTRYPQGCWPGSDDWIAQEKLFDLRAICRSCHEDIHQVGRV
jgi:hypothetical protein